MSKEESNIWNYGNEEYMSKEESNMWNYGKLKCDGHSFDFSSGRFSEFYPFDKSSGPIRR